ncbi:MAG: alpha/beta hydrolase [Deltaproteobacteria bacterium]|nr:alpha/beta hydrolase [Deltaproteobacteria bacterium]
MPYFQGVFGKIFYVKRGKGFPIILIPGMGASHQEWFQQFPTLSKHCQVISLDNAGSGKSVHPDCEISIEQMAEDVHRLMQHLKLEKVALVGSSMGGLIAQHCLEKWPEKISGLVLSATFGHVDQHIMQILGPLLRSRQSTKVRIHNVLPLMLSAQFIKEHPAIVRHYAQKAEKFAAPREVLQKQVRAVLNFTPHPIRRTHTIPIMIFAGSEDPITPPKMAHELQKRYPQATLHIFEGAKHLLHVERAKEFNEMVQYFIRVCCHSES